MVKPFLSLVIAAVWLPQIAAAQQGQGLEVGAKAPAVALLDQNAKKVTLDGLLDDGPVAVVFYRSADW